MLYLPFLHYVDVEIKHLLYLEEPSYAVIQVRNKFEKADSVKFLLYVTPQHSSVKLWQDSFYVSLSARKDTTLQRKVWDGYGYDNILVVEAFHPLDINEKNNSKHRKMRGCRLGVLEKKVRMEGYYYDVSGRKTRPSPYMIYFLNNKKYILFK